MNAAVQRLRRPARELADYGRPVVGRLTDIRTDGQVIVELPGGQDGPVTARCLANVLDPWRAAKSLVGRAVLLLCEDADPSNPIVIGIIEDRLSDPVAGSAAEVRAVRPRTAVLDGRRVVLDAAEEIVLQCGKGSLTLTADGRIVIKGTEIVSRALRANRIKGGTVNIN